MDADTLRGVVIVVLVVAAVAVAVLAVLGAAVLPAAADRLHFVAPLATIAPVVLLVAVAVERGASTWTLRVGLVSAVMLVTAPVTASALGRVMAPRERRAAARSNR